MEYELSCDLIGYYPMSLYYTDYLLWQVRAAHIALIYPLCKNRRQITRSDASAFGAHDAATKVG